ncbi:glycosyltransferase family 61 protein [Kineococcus sp. GCM10028916]
MDQFAREVRGTAVRTVPASALTTFGARYRVTETSRDVRLSVPGHLDPQDRSALRQRDVSSVPEQFTLELPEATLQGREGWVFHRGRLVEGIWQEDGFPARSLMPRWRQDSAVRLPGTTVSLLQPWLPNYYHWTVQVVPRIVRILDLLAERGEEADRWLIPSGAPGYIRQWLDLLGIPEERRLGVETRGQVFDVERLLVASVPGRNRWVSPSTVEQVRAAVAHVPPGAGGRRLLLQREGERRRVLLNAPEVVDALTRRGFEVVDPGGMTVAEEASLFSGADLVVGVHGAGLTNLVFCRPGATVVELTPRGLLYPTFVKLAAAAEVGHHMVIGTEPRLPWPLRFPDVDADLVVDVPELSAVVDRVLRGSTHGISSP